MPPLFKVGTQCGNSARWGLYGGRRVIGVPTVTGCRNLLHEFELFIGEWRQKKGKLTTFSSCQLSNKILGILLLSSTQFTQQVQPEGFPRINVCQGLSGLGHRLKALSLR